MPVGLLVFNELEKKVLYFNYPFKLHIAKPFDLFSSYYESAYFITDFGLYFSGYP